MQFFIALQTTLHEALITHFSIIVLKQSKDIFCVHGKPRTMEQPGSAGAKLSNEAMIVYL